MRVARFAPAIAVAITCVLLAELVLQVLDKPSPNVSGWRFTGRDSEKNQLGFRGQPIRYTTDDFVIVLLGDSQSYGTLLCL